MNAGVAITAFCGIVLGSILGHVLARWEYYERGYTDGLRAGQSRKWPGLETKEGD